MGPTVTLFSFHLFSQRRRGGMHWLCDSFRALGWRARFITCDFSWITRLKGDRRTEFGQPVGLNRLVSIADNLSVGVVHSPFHPVGRAGTLAGRVLDIATCLYPFPVGGVVADFARGADLVIIESCGALRFVPIIRGVAHAPIVYRVSDNLRVIRPVPSLLRAEREALPAVDVVSVASDFLARQFAELGGPIRLHPMGLEKDLFDQCNRNPYPADGRKRVVISGSSGLDAQAVINASRLFPEWEFILFGSTKSPLQAPNLVCKGEVPFTELVPWVKHADIGFAPYLQQPGFEYQAEHSNRLLQYTYSALPCVVPRQLCTPSKVHFFGYGDAGDEASIKQAFLRAASEPRANVPVDSVMDWRQIAARIIDDAAHARPALAP